MRSRGLSTTSERTPPAEGTAPAGAFDGEIEIVETAHQPFVKAAGDKLRVIIAAVVFLVSLLAAAIFRSLISGAEQDVVRTVKLVPDTLARFLIPVGQYMGVLAPIGLVIAVIVVRRARVAVMVLIASAASIAGLYAITAAFNIQVVLPGEIGQVRGIAYPGPYFLAIGAATVTVLGPWFNRGLRRLGIGTIVLVGFTRILSGANVPYDIIMSAVLGWLVGTIVVAVFGSPNRHPRGRDVADALQRAGVKLRRLELVGEGVRGATVYVATTPDGDRRFVKVFSSDQRDADLVLQAYRWIRIRDAGDERPFSSLRRAVEHEALIALKATADGIATAPLVAVSEVDPEGMLLAFEFVSGDSVEGAGPDGISDTVLRNMWRVAAELQAHHLAHRDLRLAHLLVDHDDSVTLVDFSFAELAAHPTQLRADIAELLCATAVEVGAERAVAAALDVLGPQALGDALRRIQPLALTSHTRKAIGAQSGLLEEVQLAVQEAAGIEEVEYEELARVKPRTIVTIVVLTVAIYALLPRFADVGGIGEQLRAANWVWLVPVVFFQCATYVGAAMGMVGGVPDRVAFFPTVRAQVAAAFVDVLAPAGVAGLALNTRFMQKRGVDPAVAVAGVGVNAIGGIIGHVLLLGGFILWAGTNTLDSATSGSQPVTLPGWQTLAIVVACVAGMIGLAFAIPFSRSFIKARVVPMVGDAFRGLAELARRPLKLVEVIGGSIIVTLGFTMAFVCTVQAFGGGPSVAQLGVAYLAAWAVAVFAPTPGGLGALEVALIAALGRLGMASEAAVSSVLVFRTFTFWLPVLPGWLTFTWLQRHAEI